MLLGNRLCCVWLPTRTRTGRLSTTRSLSSPTAVSAPWVLLRPAAWQVYLPPPAPNQACSVLDSRCYMPDCLELAEGGFAKGRRFATQDCVAPSKSCRADGCCWFCRRAMTLGRCWACCPCSTPLATTPSRPLRSASRRASASRWSPVVRPRPSTQFKTASFNPLCWSVLTLHV